MFPILTARDLAPHIRRFTLAAPRIARAWRPGQFVIVRLHERGERVPLTLLTTDPAAGSLELVVQGVGKTTHLMNRLGAGDAVLDVVGPLGRPAEIRRFGTVVVVGGGVGAAIACPLARALHEAGNRVIAILGARSRELVILEEEMASASDELLICTDDGGYGRAGLVTDALAEILAASPDDLPRRVVAAGPLPMMAAVAELTRPHRLPTVASLNPIMVDGTGMCGGCRVLVGGRSRFACVDGPEFDAHQVDFDALARRNAQYRPAERRALETFLAHPEEHLALARRHAPAAREVSP